MSRITPKRALIAAGVIGIGLLIIVLLAGLMAQGMISDRQGLGGGTSADSSMPEDGFVADEKSAQRVAGGDAPNSSRANLDAAVVEQKVISNGYVTTESGDVGALRADAVKVVTTAGGHIQDEQTSTNTEGVITSSNLTVRVPSAKFEDTMAKLAKLGRLIDLSKSAQDVTTEVLDVEARVRVQTAAVQRIEKLMERANSIRDIVALESELSNRQAELESLKAQATWLGNQTAMSTISINLQRVGTKSTPNAFVDGLRSGWHSLSASFSALITVLGALIPWLIVVGPVLAIVWWRRRRNGRSAATTAT